MVQGKDTLINWFKANKSPYWDIRKAEAGPIIIRSDQDDGLELDKSLQRLEEAIDMLGPGTYHISAWCTQKQATNTRFKTMFKHGLGFEGDLSGLGGIYGHSNLKDVIREEVQRDKEKQELETLRREKQDWENEKNSILWEMTQQAKPYIGLILQGIFGIINPGQGKPTAQLAGTQESQDLNSNEKRLANAFKKWSQLDPSADQILIIEKIAELAEKNPSTYQTAKQILLSK